MFYSFSIFWCDIYVYEGVGVSSCDVTFTIARWQFQFLNWAFLRGGLKAKLFISRGLEPLDYKQVKISTDLHLRLSVVMSVI